MKNNNKINKISLNKIKQKKSIGRFSLEVSLNELTNNQSETKAKINSQIKFCLQKSLKTILRSNALNDPLCFYWLTWVVQKYKINT